jgi:Tol biopolymer transport system component
MCSSGSLAVFALCTTAHALTFTQVTYPAPATEKRSGRDVKLSGDGLYAAFQSDSDFAGTEQAVHAYQAHHVWMRDLGAGGAFTLLSNATKPSDLDAKRVALDHTGAHACYDSQVPGEESIMKWTKGGTTTRVTSMPKSPATNLHSPDGKRDLAASSRCDISADGSCIVFVSDAHLADESETLKCDMTLSADKQGCIEVGKSKDQVYMTCDDGQSFTLVTPASLVTSSSSQGAVVSGDGKFVAFRSKSDLIPGVETSSKGEAFMYEVATKKLAKVTKFGAECSKDAIYDKLVELHGEGTLTNASVTKGSTSSCNYFAAQGFISSTATTGVGAPDSPSISDSGRFLTYTTNFDAADTRGSYDADVLVTNAHLFLFDAHLGMTSQVTKEGKPGAEHNQMTEDICCPSAPSSKKRGTCKEKDELQGTCCWQKPCSLFALNAEISGDGNSIVFLSDFDHTGAKEHLKGDLDVFHYYIPTSTFTRITKTGNTGYDEVDPSISYAGDRVAFGSDYVFANSTDYSARDISDRNHIFLAEIAMGCSGNTDATNYLASPDVETCCTWNEDIQPHAAGAAAVKVTLTFSLDQAAMIGRVPFAENGNAFCGRLAEGVKSDVACALDVPPSLITVDTGDAACGWASDSNKAVTVELTLHQFCLGSVAGLAEPAALASQIVSQHADSTSRLWRGYLTKTLDKDTEPAVTNIAATTTDETCDECSGKYYDAGDLTATSAGSCYDMGTHQVTCNVAEADCDGSWYKPGYVSGHSGCCHCAASCGVDPTLAPTPAPTTPLPTAAPTPSPTEEVEPEESGASLLALAAIAFLC